MLTKEEIGKMENLLSDSRFAHWGISSIHQWAKRMDILYVSLNSWYKYNNLFGWRNLKKRFRKANYSPLRASKPDQYWHADVSVHKCLDGTKGYIYAVVDNASRKVLAWNVLDRLSGVGMKEVLKLAVDRKREADNDLKLIMDGGAENFNKQIDSFLTDVDLTRLQATVDIQQSNSMVEAVFKQLKHQYLLRKNIYTLSQLKKHVDFFFEDANQNKPLAVLHGLTPDEFYAGRQVSEIKVDEQFISKVKKERSIQNRTNLCFSCSADSG